MNQRATEGAAIPRELSDAVRHAFSTMAERADLMTDDEAEAIRAYDAFRAGAAIPAGESVAREALRELVALFEDDPLRGDGDDEPEPVRRARAILRGEPVERLEPVAWRWRDKGATEWIYNPRKEWLDEFRDEIECEPLYAAPSPSACRGEGRDAFTSWVNGPHINDERER